MGLIKRYIPCKVNDFISKCEFKNKDHLYVICDMIYRIGIFRKNDDSGIGYVDIPIVYFYNIITKKSSFKIAMDYLKNNNIIECDGTYIKGSKSFGYKFSNEFVSKLVTIYIGSKSLSSRIIKNINDNNNGVSQRYQKYKFNYLNNFKIDYDKARNYIDDWYDNKLSYLNVDSPTYLNDFIKLNNKYNSYFISISAINDGDLFFRKNSTNGRIDTNLTSLKSELKQFIIGDYYQIDITNSQPFFLLLDILESNPKLSSSLNEEIIKYDNWVTTGNFYENFQHQYFLNCNIHLTRKEIKNMIFCILFSKNNSYLKLKKVFSSIFPEIMTYINFRKSKKHNILAVSMQKLESNMCIETICQDLDNNNIPYFTIHDAWVIDKKYTDKTNEIIQEHFNTIYGKCPKLDIKSLKEKKQMV